MHRVNRNARLVPTASVTLISHAHSGPFLSSPAYSTLQREVTSEGFSFLWSNCTQKGTGSELAGMLSFVIMFYTQGNFNVQRWEAMIRLELHMFFWQPGHRHLNSLLTALWIRRPLALSCHLPFWGRFWNWQYVKRQKSLTVLYILSVRQYFSTLWATLDS